MSDARICPTCGQRLPPQETAADLVRLLAVPVQHVSRYRNNDQHRDVYLGRDGFWYLTHAGELEGRHRFDHAVIERLIKDGTLARTYPECADVYRLARP